MLNYFKIKKYKSIKNKFPNEVLGFAFSFKTPLS